MDACLETGVDYLDTANYEPLDDGQVRVQVAVGLPGALRASAGSWRLLGSGFDPGVTNVFTRVRCTKHHFDEIDELDIIDCNAGDHGQPFATNFNPEINIREVTARGRYWENGALDGDRAAVASAGSSTSPRASARRRSTCMYHEELESLVKHIPSLQARPASG